MSSGPARLDTRPARPLTSREISKVLCSILSGVAHVDPDEIATFPDQLALVGPTPLSFELHTDGEKIRTSWRTAFSATVGGFYAWCDPSDIETALAWVSQNLDRMFPRQTQPPS